MDIIAKAKTNLIVNHPFFATILLSMPMIQDDSIPTMGVNGEDIRYNKSFVESLTLKELVFVLAHEVMHCAFQHMLRRGHRNPAKWNIAADYVINEILVNDRVGSMPKGGLHDPAIVQKGNGTTEGVYGLLPKEDEQKKPGSGPGGGGGSMDEVHDMDESKKGDLIVKVIQARSAAKMAGKLSAGLERLVNDMVNPTVPWRDVLRRFINVRAKIDPSFARPKRRFLSEDLILPSLSGEKMGRLAVAVDCSGSIDKNQLEKFSAEIKAIISDAQPESVDVLYFDSKVCARESFKPEDFISLKPQGGGGTDFAPIFEAINGDPEAPVCLVVLTDLDCHSFGNCPEYPVLWVSTAYDKAPFGEVILMKGEG